MLHCIAQTPGGVSNLAEVGTLMMNGSMPEEVKGAATIITHRWLIILYARPY
jgi:hypothetical protein